MVNNPFNRIARKSYAERNLATELIDYTTLERVIEYAATRGAHDVVLMGEEVLTPVGKAKFAGEKIRRRTTEVWSDVSGQWKLRIRQATIYRTKLQRTTASSSRKLTTPATVNAQTRASRVSFRQLRRDAQVSASLRRE